MAKQIIERRYKSKMSLEDELENFTGTERHYKHPLGIKYTDGVKYLADKAGAYWILDCVASYQPKFRNKDFQVWKLKKNENNTAVLTMREDEGQPELVRQKIPYTDFPLDEISLWCENGVLILPSEH